MTDLPVSAAIIAFNEEGKIEDCIKSLWWVDEIVVVDSHSADRTREIAKKLGARVIERDWPGHINQKNFALNAVRNPYVISLDADERVSEKLRGEILAALTEPDAGEYNGWAIPRRVFYINRWIRYCGWYPQRKVRFVKKDKARWGGIDPHDRLIVSGKVKKLSGDIYHLSFDSIHDHFKTIDRFTEIGAREALKEGKRANVLDVTIRPLFTFFKMYFLKLGFLDGVPGLIVCALSAFHTFTKYERMREMG